MNRIIIIAIMAVVGAFEGLAQNYKSGALYELSGPVKDVKYKTENPFILEKSLKFLEDGRQKLSTWVYNKEGYPFASGFLTSPNSWHNYLVNYDDQNRVETINFEYAAKNGISKNQLRNFYDGNRLAKSVMTDLSDGTPRETATLTYSGEKYDSQGNWIERDVTMTLGNSVPKSFTETRTIRYYDTNK